MSKHLFGFWGRLCGVGVGLLLAGSLSACGGGGSLVSDGTPAQAMTDHVNLTVALHAPAGQQAHASQGLTPWLRQSASPSLGAPLVGNGAPQGTQKYIIHVLDPNTEKELVTATEAAVTGEAVQTVTLVNVPVGDALIEVDACDTSGTVLQHSTQALTVAANTSTQADVSFDYAAATDLAQTYNFMTLQIHKARLAAQGTVGVVTWGYLQFDSQNANFTPQFVSASGTLPPAYGVPYSLGSDGLLQWGATTSVAAFPAQNGFVTQDRSFLAASGWSQTPIIGQPPQASVMTLALPQMEQDATFADLQGVWNLSQLTLSDLNNQTLQASQVASTQLTVDSNGQFVFSGQTYQIKLTGKLGGFSFTRPTQGTVPGVVGTGFLSKDRNLAVLESVDLPVPPNFVQSGGTLTWTVLTRVPQAQFVQRDVQAVWDTCGISVNASYDSNSVADFGFLGFDATGSVLSNLFSLTDATGHAVTLGQPPQLSVDALGVVKDVSSTTASFRAFLSPRSSFMVGTAQDSSTQGTLRILRRR